MSNLVEQINDAIEVRLAVVLGVNWSKMSYVLDVGKNNLNSSNKRRYGARPIDASQVPGVTRSYTLNQSFEIILTQEHSSISANDRTKFTASFNLYDQMDNIFIDLINKKAGLSAIILLVNAVEMDEPEYLEELDLVVLRSRVTIKYRNSL